MVVVDVLLGRRQDEPACDAILCIVDASNLERNLYLVSQVLELGLPTVLALNMIDIARDRGLAIDAKLLSERLGVAVVIVQANKRIGLNELKAALIETIGRPVPRRESPFPETFQAEVARLEAVVNCAMKMGMLSRKWILRCLDIWWRDCCSIPVDIWKRPESSATSNCGGMCKRHGRVWRRQGIRFRPSRRWPATSG